MPSAIVLLQLALALAAPATSTPFTTPAPPNGTIVASNATHDHCSCSTHDIEIECKCTGIPVLNDVGIDAKVDTAKLEIDVDLEFDGKTYQIYHLSAHNPQVCIDEIKVAKVCAKIDDLQWDNDKVSGKLYLGVGVIFVGTEWFKVATFSIPI